jgi:Uma2 family endonuclease
MTPYSEKFSELLPDAENLLTEDETPVDNLPSEKQQRLLVEVLYSTGKLIYPDWQFLAAANVGLYYAVRQNPLVPDVFLSLDVQVPEDWWQKKNRVYLTWEFGKPPEVVIEIVSNLVGNEDGSKLKDYARAGVLYYVIFDPLNQLKQGVLRLYKLQGWQYELISDTWMPEIKLGLTLWEGSYEDKNEVWLRWCNQHNQVIATGAERAEQERQRAEDERQRAEQEQEKRQRLVERLRLLSPEQLAELGISAVDLE